MGVTVDVTLDGCYYFGRILDFIQDDRCGMVAQKKIGLPPRIFDIQAGVEHHVVNLGKKVAEQRGLCLLYTSRCV